jgi:16S rRNA (cytosine1402-N4)-methyltransferase
MTHIPVLLKEVIAGFDLKPGNTYLDGTLGSGGHARLVCERFGPSIRIIGIDRDSDAIIRTEETFKNLPNEHHFVLDEFRNLDNVLSKLHIEKVDGILFDLGISSPHVDTSGRGFSFMRDEPLLMTMEKDPTEEKMTAYDVVNTWDEDNLETIIRYYGEEKYSRRIARNIVSKREEKPIKTTFELVSIIKEAVPALYRFGKIHPATRTFQAIRIAVNDELENLKEGLIKGFDHLLPGGTLAVISFHSLEDRIVKHFFQEKAKNGDAFLINKKPIIPTEEETKNNPRARSSKLRIIKKL